MRHGYLCLAEASRSRRLNPKAQSYATRSARLDRVILGLSELNSRRPYIPTWMASPSQAYPRQRSDLARRRFYAWPVPHLAGDRVAAECARSRNADSAHGSTPSAHDVCCSLDLSGQTCQDIDLLDAASLCASNGSTVPVGGSAPRAERADPSCNLLAGSGRHTGRMAYPCGVCARVAIANVARN